MKNKLSFFGFLVSLALLTSCASTPPQGAVAFSSTSVNEGESIGIYIDELPKVGMNYPGANCLLCLAAAAAANGGVSGHARTLSNDELGSDFAADIARQFAQDGIKSTILQGAIDLKKLKKSSFESDIQARKDYTVLASAVNNTHLLVVDINYSGLGRQYANYLATSPPYALISGSAFIVDLQSNEYLWYLPIVQRNSAGTAWKEPPNYPTLTNEFYKAIATVRDNILTGLKANTLTE